MKKTIEPPKWAVDFLEWFCPDNLFESIYGDLLEEFDEDVKIDGVRKAKRRFTLKVIQFFRPGIIMRNSFNFNLISHIMVASYFKIATRSIMKRKLYSFINAFGLSIGIAFCILIFLFIKDEKSFDHFHSKKESIYRLHLKSYQNTDPGAEDPYSYSAYLPISLKYDVIADIPEVQLATRFNSGMKYNVKKGDHITNEPVTFVDSEFFRMFSFKALKGNKDKFLTEKHHVVITPTIAQKFFGDEDPIEQTLDITINGISGTYTVVGIIEEAPASSSLEYNILLAQENQPYYENNLPAGWNVFTSPTFVLLYPEADPDQFRSKLDLLVKKYKPGIISNLREKHNLPEDVEVFNIQALPITEVHLANHISWHKVSDPEYSIILGGIALLILLIACINYITLALTTSASRRIEVGIRKAIGAKKEQIFSQFSFEAVTLSIISMIMALGLAALFLPSFNEFTQKGITISGSILLQIIAFSAGLSLLIGLLAGSYPAVFLSSFKPTTVLKGGYSYKLKAGFTKPLIVVQFALSAFLIISSIIMYRQMDFITTKDLGYDQDQVVVIPTQAGWNIASNSTVRRFREKAMNEPDVLSVGGSSSSLGTGSARYFFTIDGEEKFANVYTADPHYISTLVITMAAGRNFDPEIISDSSAIIINEAFAKEMGWENPLEERLEWRRGYRVIGVMEDYHFSSLEQAIEPMFLTMDIGYLSTMLIKIKADNIPTTIEKLQKHYASVAPDKPFEYKFLEEDVARQYVSYERWMKIMGLSTAFAILISCLGLFGLAGVNALNKTKEIGIRKVFGAELVNIFVLLNRQFVVLAIIAFFIAIPASWYIMQQWLDNFKFAITVSWELFALSIVVGVSIALLTVSYHAIKSALLNPAETLKCE
ncbi:MAG: ABC transporter permease [Candidatus Cyclobacteriaceae bacterium M2_1C_046]